MESLLLKRKQLNSVEQAPEGINFFIGHLAQALQVSQTPCHYRFQLRWLLAHGVYWDAYLWWSSFTAVSIYLSLYPTRIAWRYCTHTHENRCYEDGPHGLTVRTTDWGPPWDPTDRSCNLLTCLNYIQDLVCLIANNQSLCKATIQLNLVMVYKN